MTDYSLKRGPWGKPYVTRDFGPLDWPEGARDPLNGFLYSRPSDISGSLDTKENLSPYQQCQVVVGLMLDSAYGGSLAVQFKALVSEHGLQTWEKAKGDVKDLLKQSRAKGGEEWKSGMGTGFHRYAHLRDIGAEVILPSKDVEPWLDCYEEAMQRFEVLDDECFVVADDLVNPDSPDDVRCAGNFDRLLRDKETGEIMVGDIKTGRQDNEFAMKVHVQLAIYAHGVRYEQETGRRWPIHADLSLTKGVMIHVPMSGGGAPCCDIYPIDLVEGWRLAKLSMDIERARKMRCYKRDALVRTK